MVRNKTLQQKEMVSIFPLRTSDLNVVKVGNQSLKIPKGYLTLTKRVWRYQRGYHNLYIEEEPTTQWPKEKVQKDKQRSIKHTYKTKDRVTRTPLKTGGELRCSGRVGSSCSTNGTRRVNLVTNISVAPVYGVYVSQLVRYSRACSLVSLIED
jgi:hypothetical protein